jgi:hypothetical protein
MPAEHEPSGLPAFHVPPPLDELDVLEELDGPEAPEPLEELVVDEPPAPVEEPELLENPVLVEVVMVPWLEPEPHAWSSAAVETNRVTARVDSRIMVLLWMGLAACIAGAMPRSISAVADTARWPPDANAGLPWPTLASRGQRDLTCIAARERTVPCDT